MNLTLILLCIGGLALHFLGRYGEFWRTGEKVGPHIYAMQDLPGWIFALVATGVCMLLLPDLPKIIGMPVGFDAGNSGLMRILAFLAGYTGSSIAAKVPAYFTGQGVR